MTALVKVCNGLQSLKNLLQPTLETVTTLNQGFHHKTPRKRFPPWFIKQQRAPAIENLTKENKEFLQEVIKHRYPQPDAYGNPSPLKFQIIEPTLEWQPHYQRVGVIAKKIGIYPLWMKNGNKILTTLFQVIDNHVIKYTPPEEYKPMITKRKDPRQGKKGCIIVGADSCDPQLFTKEYCGLFTEAGVMPKRLLARFQVSPEAALQPGTPLFASHFKVDQHVDIRGVTIDRGFQGVMKRWGFHGMPASHGVTKTHRRGGNIGSGGKKARVMPGTKMPGHMGNAYRILKAQRIIRINTKYNVIWVLGQASPGGTNSLVQIFDTKVYTKTPKTLNQTPYFPTYFPNPEELLPEEILVDDLHNFNDPTIMFKEE